MKRAPLPAAHIASQGGGHFRVRARYAGRMADDQATEREDTPRGGIPSDPEAQRRWAEKFTDDIMDGEPGGTIVPWRRDR